MSLRSLPARSEKNLWRSPVPLTVLFGIGGLVMGVYLYDLALELKSLAYPLWVLLAENVPGIGLSAGILAIGARARGKGQIYRSEAAKGCLVGFAAALGTGLFLLGLRQVRGGAAPMVYMLVSAGTFAGTLVGYFQAEGRRVRRELRSITENVSEGIYRSAAEEGIVYANQAFAEMFGYGSVEEVLQVEPASLYPDPSKREELLERTSRQGGFEGEEVQFQRADGSVFTGRVTDTIVRGEDGKVAYCDGVISDVTEQKQAERRRRRMAQAIGAASDGIAILDEEGTYTYMNQAHAEIFGRESPEAFLGNSWRMCYREEEQKRFEEEVMPHLYEQGSWRGEVTGQRKGGELFPQSITLTRLEGGGIICVCRDITERRRRERKLRVLTETVDQATDGILVTEAAGPEAGHKQNRNRKDGAMEGGAVEEGTQAEGTQGGEGGVIVYANPAFEEMSGWAEEELRGRTARVLRGPETEREVIRSLEEAVRDRRPWEGETVNYRKDGTPYVCWWTATPIFGEEGQVRYWASIHRDVTEKRKREKQLQRQKALLEQAQRLAGAWEADLKAGEVSWSEKVYEIHEMEPSVNVSLEEGLEFYAPGSRDRIAEATRALVREGEPYDLELQIDTTEGNRRWVRTVGAPVEEEGGEVVKVAGAFQDITARKTEEKRRQQVIERVTDAIVEVDSGWRFTLANEQAEELYDMREEDLLGRNFWEVFEGALGTRFEDEYRGAMHSRKPTRFEAHYPQLDGWFDIQVYPNEDGGLSFYFEDVTERKRRQQQIERQNDLFERAQEIAGVGAWEYDVKTDTGNWTPKAYEILGYPLEEDPDLRTAVECYHPEDQPRVREALRRALQEGKPSDLEVRVGSGDGVRWARIRGEPQLEDGEVVRIRGTIQDITERKERERALREAKGEAEQASRMKSSFLANMSHEIRTPLTSIIGFAEALGSEAAELDLPEGSPLPQHATLIEQGGKRLLETLEGVLNLSKLEAGQMKLSEGRVDLATEAGRTAEELRSKAREKGVGLRVQTQRAQARADGGGVQIVARNLLSNAIKYTEEGGTVWLRTYWEDNRAVLEVEDTGVGMEPEEAEGLFEPFRQASEGWSREYEGTGVGLAVTKKATEQMGGSVEVETQKGEGSRFSVRLPPAEGASAEGDSGDGSG